MQPATVHRVTVALSELSTATRRPGNIRGQGGVLPRGVSLFRGIFGLQTLIEDFIVHFILMHGPRHGRGHHARLVQ